MHQLMDWKEDYKRKYTTPDEAVKHIKSENVIAIPIDTPVVALCSALLRRSSELENVKLLLRSPSEGLNSVKKSLISCFNVVIDTQIGSASTEVTDNQLTYMPFLTSLRFKGDDDSERTVEKFDVVMVVISPPDSNGFCSFGPYLSHKRDYVRRAKTVIAEVSDSIAMSVRPCGDNYVHVSEIDCFVPHTPVPHKKRTISPPDEIEHKIAGYVSTLIRDGDTIQLGPGVINSSIASLGGFDGKEDLGCHSAFIGPEILNLIKEGRINGKRKNINTGKATSGGFLGLEKKEDFEFVNNNPQLQVCDMSYVNNVQVIASNDHMVAVNSVLAVDLMGQMAADTLGSRMFGGAGGQVDFVMGAMLSKGGRSITALRSTAERGNVSRIMFRFTKGTIVTIPYTLTDFVVTEYGIASLFGKSQRERANELINVAHPDFRAELRKLCEKLL